MKEHLVHHRSFPFRKDAESMHLIVSGVLILSFFSFEGDAHVLKQVQLSWDLSDRNNDNQDH